MSATLFLSGNKALARLAELCHEHTEQSLIPGILIESRFNSGFPGVIIELFIAKIFQLAEEGTLKFRGHKGGVDANMRAFIEWRSVKAIEHEAVVSGMKYSATKLVERIMEELATLPKYRQWYLEAKPEEATA